MTAPDATTPQEAAPAPVSAPDAPRPVSAGTEAPHEPTEHPRVRGGLICRNDGLGWPCPTARNGEDPPNGSEALRARLADWLCQAWNVHNATGTKDVTDASDWWLEAEAMEAQVLAYGDEREKRGGEKALREAAAHFEAEVRRVEAEPASHPEASAYKDGRSNAYEFAADEMAARADEIRGATP